MPDSIWALAALLSAALGMAWLALAMEVHWRQVQGHAPRSPALATKLRTIGFAGLIAALVFCLLADTATMAVLVWMMLLAVGAILVAFVLSWRPRLLAIAWPAGSRD